MCQQGRVHLPSVRGSELGYEPIVPREKVTGAGLRPEVKDAFKPGQVRKAWARYFNRVVSRDIAERIFAYQMGTNDVLIYSSNAGRHLFETRFERCL